MLILPSSGFGRYRRNTNIQYEIPTDQFEGNLGFQISIFIKCQTILIPEKAEIWQRQLPILLSLRKDFKCLEKNRVNTIAYRCFEASASSSQERDFMLIHHIRVTHCIILKTLLIGKTFTQMLKRGYQKTFKCQRGQSRERLLMQMLNIHMIELTLSLSC